MPVRSLITKAMFVLTACALALAGCAAPQTTATPNPDAAASPVIRQVLTGVEGNNNVEFIELYNPTDRVFALGGYRLVYRLATSEDDLPVVTFEQTASIPPHGYYLLGRQGVELPITPDSVFQQSLNDSGGGLGLIGPDDALVDAVGWGRAPARLSEGAPAPAVENGTALLRRSSPTAEAIDTDVNLNDFVTTIDVQPHNSGSRTTMATASPITLTVKLPDQVNPGQEFHASFKVESNGNTDMSDISVTLPLPSGVTVLNPPADISQDQDQVMWQVKDLQPGASAELDLALTAPWRFGQLRFASASAAGQEAIAYSGPRVVAINESPIPIDIARGLVNQDVMVEGTATMYTGGLFAGSGNVKFYLSDASGGVQVWVPAGEGNLQVAIGDSVRVRGRIERYRGTIELIAEPPTAVELLDTGEDAPAPVEVVLDDLIAEPEAYAGQLVRVEGELSQADESSFGYDLQLRSDRGAALFAYIDEMTGLNIDRLVLDQPYALTGVLETPDGVATLYPRVNGDLERQYPSAVVLDIQAPPSLEPNQSATIQLDIGNHTDETVADLSIQAPAPTQTASISDVSGPGKLANGMIQWTVDRLAPGEIQSVSYSLRSRAGAGQIQLPAATVVGADGQELTQTQSVSIFVGSTVPVYAIQGQGDRSPFVGQEVHTEGTVTAVFPELGGFFLQGKADLDPTTSDGVFVAADPLPVDIESGNAIDISGTVREIGHQTTVQVGRSDEVRVLRSGQTLPAAAPLDPPADADRATAYYESLEGMLVSIDEPAVAIGPTNQYGETPLVLARYRVDRIFQTDPSGRMITVDDGSDVYHQDRSTLPFAVTTGQQLNQLIGPLAFTFGQFKIEPTGLPVVSGQAEQPPLPLPIPDGSWRVMTWNAENLFDILEPNPSSPPRPHKEEYDIDLAKVAATIELAGAPTVVALQEVENLGILEDLAALPALQPYSYQPLLIEGTDSRGIDVGYLVRTAATKIIELRQLPVPEGLTSRPPLQLVIDVVDGDQLRRLALFNNHFTALSAGVELTAPRRRAQAALNADAVEALMKDNAYDGFIVLGDLNSFYGDPSLEPLRAAGMTDALAEVPADERYTYIYQGVSQVLDHMYLSAGLSSCLASVQILHVDADFPPPAPNDRSAIRKSDHDPLVATFDCLR